MSQWKCSAVRERGRFESRETMCSLGMCQCCLAGKRWVRWGSYQVFAKHSSPYQVWDSARRWRCMLKERASVLEKFSIKEEEKLSLKHSMMCTWTKGWTLLCGMPIEIQRSTLQERRHFKSMLKMFSWSPGQQGSEETSSAPEGFAI